MTDITCRALGDEAELAAFARIGSVSFGEPVADARGWIESIGLPNARIATLGGRVAGGLCLIHVGQWFGGRPVPMTGISSVAVDPADRARGVARLLMREALRELHEQGVALSALSASTQPLYRGVGYEQAGLQCKIRMPSLRLFTVDRSLEARGMTPADHDACATLHREFGRVHAGMIERDAVMWRWVRDGSHPDRDEIHGFVLEGDAGLEGYVHCKTALDADGAPSMHLTDVAVTTPAAARSMLGFLRDQRSMMRAIEFRGYPTHPLLLAAREQRHQVTLWDTWMLRLVRVPAALEARGYPVGVRASVEFDVVDDVLPENAGPLVLSVADGRGQVAAGGSGRVRIDVRTLAALYSGYVSPLQAVTGFALECSEEDADAMAAVFAGPCPWMADHY